MSGNSESQTRSIQQLEIGDVVVVRLPGHFPQGHEQEGMRPGLIVGLPSNLGTPRFPVVVIAPFTTDRNAEWAERNPALYPRFAAGAGNLSSDSICLLDQIRSVDVSRIARRWGRVSLAEFTPVRTGLRQMMEHPQTH
jgi:mRNA interferase MazF